MPLTKHFNGSDRYVFTVFVLDCCLKHLFFSLIQTPWSSCNVTAVFFPHCLICIQSSGTFIVKPTGSYFTNSLVLAIASYFMAAQLADLTQRRSVRLFISLFRYAIFYLYIYRQHFLVPNRVEW